MSKRAPSICFKPSGSNKPCTTIINGDLKVKGNLNAKIQLPKGPQTIKSGFLAFNSNPQAISPGETTINFNTESFDIGNDYDISSNQFTASSNGYYQINSNIEITSSSNQSIEFEFELRIYVNSQIISTGSINYQPNSIVPIYPNISAFTNLNTNDTVEIKAFVTFNGGISTLTIDPKHFSIAQIGI